MYIRILALRLLLKWISWASVRPLVGGAVVEVVVAAVISGSRRGRVGGDGVAHLGSLAAGRSVVVLLLRGRRSLDDVGPAEPDEEEGDDGDQQEDDRREGGRVVEPALADL